MSLPALTRRSSRSRRNGVRGSFVLLLALSLWRGPLPWLHAHEGTPSGVSGEAQLAWHVQCLHADALSRDSIQGWHWHFVLSNDLDGDGRQDGDSSTAFTTSLLADECEKSLVEASESDAGPFAWISCAASRESVEPLSLQSDSVSPFAAEEPTLFRSGAAVRLLASVALC